MFIGHIAFPSLFIIVLFLLHFHLLSNIFVSFHEKRTFSLFFMFLLLTLSHFSPQFSSFSLLTLFSLSSHRLLSLFSRSSLVLLFLFTLGSLSPLAPSYSGPPSSLYPPFPSPQLSLLLPYFFFLTSLFTLHKSLIPLTSYHPHPEKFKPKKKKEVRVLS
jgi:hypothetical protein